MSLLRRALTGVSATAVLSAVMLSGAAPAQAVPSDICVQTESIRLFTANDGEYKVWIDETTSSTGFRETHLCWAASNLTAGEFVVRTPISGTLTPSVSPDTTDENCPRLLEIQDPVQLMTRLSENLLGNPGFLCFGVGDEAFRVTFTLPNPAISTRVNLMLDKGTLAADLYCANFPIPDSDCTNSSIDYVRVV